MVQEMYRLCSQVRQAVTFPIRASLTRASIPQLQWLLEKSNRYLRDKIVKTIHSLLCILLTFALL